MTVAEWQSIETRKATAFRSFVSGFPHSRCSDAVAFEQWRDVIWWRRNLLFASYQAAKLSGPAAWTAYQALDSMLVGTME